MERLGIGILGCGPIAQFAHLEACRKARNIDLIAVCDADEYLANKMGGYYEARNVYTDYHRMLEDQDVDAIIVAVSDAFHIPAALLAANAGKHVLTEKPLGDQLGGIPELQSVIKQKKLVFQVGHMKRFDPGISSAREFIRNKMGDMVAYKGWYADSTHRYDMTDSAQPLPFTGNEVLKPENDPKGDLKTYYLLAHGSHLIDTAIFLCSPIRSVACKLVIKEGMYSWFIDTEFEGGYNGHLDLTIAVRMDWHEGFQIYGTKGSVLGKIYNPWYFKTSRIQCFSEEEGAYYQKLDNKGHFFQRQLESFASVILEGKPQVGTSIEEGLHILKVLLAIGQSAASGERTYIEDIK